MTTQTGAGQQSETQEQPKGVALSLPEQQEKGQQTAPAEITEEQVKALRSLKIYQQDIAAAQKPLQQQIAELQKKVKGIEIDPETLRALTSLEATTERASVMAKRMGVPEDKIAKAKASRDPVLALDMLMDAYDGRASGNEAATAAGILKATAKTEAEREWATTQGGRTAGQQKTIAQLADGPWDEKAAQATLRSMGL